MVIHAQRRDAKFKIEGIFATEEELEGSISNRYKATSEVSNYFRMAKMLYGMALEYSKTGEFPFFFVC
ncbi:MAG: hypothetical protein ACUVQF_08390 [Fervidobacterium sp.]|uniref:hypothetical protein n=1 Tax=Fervidobacterium sp. TaxID=1871331 RepID=UPI0040491739